MERKTQPQPMRYAALWRHVLEQYDLWLAEDMLAGVVREALADATDEDLRAWLKTQPQRAARLLAEIEAERVRQAG